nr:phenazine biosynthesis-like domain-containing protein 1 [Procambarus clarkii]
MSLRVFTVDAFTPRPFSGNPAAVVPLPKVLEDETLQKVASEFNLSETAYLVALEGEESAPWTSTCRYSLRWFTPVQEIPLCGHATIAASHVLFHELGKSHSLSPQSTHPPVRYYSL